MRKILSRLARGVTTNLRSVTLGGEVVDQILIDGIKNVFPMVRVVHIYASTELGSSIEVRDEKAGFPLKLIDDHNLKIVDGELFVRKSSKSMLGYLQSENPSSSQKQFGEKELVPTGDLVEAVGDRVLFVGRRDDLINVGGFKVSPVAVEDVVRTVRGVGEVAISAMKNPISGNLVRADVILAQGANEHEVRAELLAVCKAKLAYYAVPRIINFVPTLNYTTTFKLKR
jgi:acyl-coenzyme A synthetase/AMP-(fatty) acid ligase